MKQDAEKTADAETRGRGEEKLADAETRGRGEDEMGILPVIDGELISFEPAEIVSSDEEATVVSRKPEMVKHSDEKSGQKIANRKSQIANQSTYLLLPFVFLTVALLGGLRLASPDNAFVFWRPALFCLIAAAMLMVLFFRAGLVRLEGWFSEDLPIVANIANGAVLLTLFAASAQVFNALLPENGLPFLVVAFCFFWTLVMNFFGSFDTRTFIRLIGAMCGLAFVVKYLILLNITAPGGEGWLQGILQNPTKEAFTWLFDLPRFSAGTAYIQFFTVAIYLLGLFLLPAAPRFDDSKN